MKTILIFNMFEDGLEFYVSEHDLSRFDDIYIGNYLEDSYLLNLQDQLSEWIQANKKDAYTEFPTHYVSPGDTKVIICGIIP